MKQIRVSGLGSYSNVYPFGQYVLLVRLLYAGSWIARIWRFAGDMESNHGLVDWWLECPQLYCIIVRLYIEGVRDDSLYGVFNAYTLEGLRGGLFLNADSLRSACTSLAEIKLYLGWVSASLGYEGGSSDRSLQ
jgi:hypothetical protein